MSDHAYRVPLPRELVLASAGSGKTYHLSSRLIGLLALGAAPESILASTFTRKAAAEILDRVLLRLAEGALDQAKARQLGVDARMPGDTRQAAANLDQQKCCRLLGDLLRSLHRLDVRTLDGFFGRVARCFSGELGMPPGWTIADGTVEARVRSEALETLLSEDPEAMVHLVRLLGAGETTRGVHSSLLEHVDALLELHRQVDPSVSDPWMPHFAAVDLDSAPERAELVLRWKALAARVEATPIPKTKAGTPARHWEKEIPRLADALRAGDWQEFFVQGVGKKLVEDGELVGAAEIEYSGHRPEAELADAVDEAARLFRIDLARQLTERGNALGAIAARYETVFSARQNAEGAYRFADIPDVLRASALMGGVEQLYFRLDARFHHVLLDEFQDTSLPQWEVLEPLVTELLAAGASERATVVVADPKQSIYGWRGARPGLVAHVKQRFGLGGEPLPKSYRSSPVVLDVVRRVFADLAANPVVAEFADGGGAARRWAQDFLPQEAAFAERPGYVRIAVGPEPTTRRSLQPGVLDRAVGLVERIHADAPRAGVGVLVRDNQSVAYLIAALRAQGVAASGEGGTPLTDAAPVNALLALLRLADHPGDSIARYHVAMTPLGAIVDLTDPRDAAGARGLAWQVRGRLLEHGYGRTLDTWVRALLTKPGNCDSRERARLDQLVELGYQWDAHASLRPVEFVQHVEGQRVEDPSAAHVRVMTIHQSKGLEFDVVVLPQLHLGLERGSESGPALPLRDCDSGSILRIYPRVGASGQALLQELRQASDQVWAAGLRDGLSSLYVAMTRARYALHLVIPADPAGRPSQAKSAARLLRSALVPGEVAVSGDQALFEVGDPDWFDKLTPGDWSAGPASASADATRATAPIALRKVSGGRSRNLPRISPSGMEGGDGVDLGQLLRQDVAGAARLLGTLVHAWCEQIDWIEDGLPSDARLRTLADEHAAGMSEAEVTEHLATFHGWMQSAAIRDVLSRARYRGAARVQQELPFVRRLPEGLLQGVIDRLVVVEQDGRVVRAEVLDFKTDVVDLSQPEALEARARYYRPQIDAYRAAVADRHGLTLEDVAGTLLFLRVGAKVEWS